MDYAGEELLNHLMNNIIPQQKHCGFSEAPPMSLPSRKKTKQLGTKTSGIDNLDMQFEQKKKK